MDIPGSHSPRSVSTSSSPAGTPPTLDPSTLALLDSFLSSKAEEEKRFNDLAEQAHARLAAYTQNREGEDHEGSSDGETGKEDPPMMSVDEYRAAFGEDWQLSQFWYSTQFATRLAESLYALCDPSSRIVFMSCPTAFVAFQHTNPLPGARLFEVDQRFAVLSPSKYVFYDLNEPDKFPGELKGKVDTIVADPPFLNETTNTKVIQTVRQLLRPDTGKLILLTSPAIQDVLDKLYTEQPIGPLRRTALNPEHGELRNEFACWGSWEGAESFGKEM